MEIHKFDVQSMSVKPEILERKEASAYGQIERKAQNSTYFTLSKIADALGVSLLFLLDVDNPEVCEQKNKL